MAATNEPAVLGGDLPEKERLAYQQGHDADSPSNEGVTTPIDGHWVDKTTNGEREKRDSSSTSIIGDPEKGPHGTTVTEEEHDPNVVDFDGPDDPTNPLNWTPSRKWANITVLSALTLLTPLASSMFAPGVPEALAEFHVDNDVLATFVVSVYLLGFAM